MVESQFKDIFAGLEHSMITVIGKNHSRHYVRMHEAAAWILNGIQWFNVLEQPMMIAIWSKDWEDAAKFQYLMQILQVNLEDYIPKWQVFVDQPETVDKLIVQWQNPTKIWAGQPVIGFMAETDFELRDSKTSIQRVHFQPLR